MKPSEVIDKALTEVIPDESAWCQKSLSTEDGKHCMAGAMMAAARGNVAHFLAGLSNRESDDPYYAARLACIKVLVDLDLNDSLPRFNDNHLYSEVRAVMEKARAELQEKGQ